MSDYSLNTNWWVWYHALDDKQWTKQSYKHIYTITNLYDLQGFHEVIQKNHLQNGMFFIMREDIFPTWEDPDNREGCCVSYKVPGRVLKEEWSNAINRVISEDILVNPEEWENMNGISIAPKKEFNIVKIWLRNVCSDSRDILKEYEPIYTSDKSIIKAHELSY